MLLTKGTLVKKLNGVGSTCAGYIYALRTYTEIEWIK